MRHWLYAGALAALMISAPAATVSADCINAKCQDTAAIEQARETIQDTCGCTRAGQTHKKYKKCVQLALKLANLTALIPKKSCRKLIKKCESASICGKLNAVVCCVVKKNTKVKGSILSSPSKCKKGSPCGAVLGFYSTFDACAADGTCAGPVTTTTTTGPPTTTTAAPTTTPTSSTTPTSEPTTTTTTSSTTPTSEPTTTTPTSSTTPTSEPTTTTTTTSSTTTNTNPRTVIVSFAGDGGVIGKSRIVSMPLGIDCVLGSTTGCTAMFADGTELTLTASGSTFVSWGPSSPMGVCEPPENAVCMISPLSENVLLFARFQ